MASRIQTRTSNQDAHPGLPDCDSETEALPIPAARKKRRNAAEMQADREAITTAKETKEQERKEGIKKVAAIENALAAADEENRQTAARPVPKAAVKIPRPKSKAMAALSSNDESNTRGMGLFILIILHALIDYDFSAQKVKTTVVRRGRSDVDEQRELLREESTQKRKASIDSAA